MSKKDLETARHLITKYGLENAVHHNGAANEKSVMQKIMATHVEMRKHSKQISDLIEELIPTINALSVEEQQKRLTEIAPELLAKKGHQKRIRELPPLKDAVDGKVVTRYAPEPNGEMHLGHAYTAFFADYYAKKYHGTFVLRFEDTNPKQERVEYMDAHREDLKWLGLNPNKEVIVSNDMPIFYEKAVELIEKNYAYTCTCSVDKMRELRGEMKSCDHSKRSSTDTMKDWKKMIAGDYKEGEIVLRLRGNMENTNAVMRDPAIFAIRLGDHCIHGKKYPVWPLYDFAVAVEDNLCGITHVGRSAEFDTRIELQNKIRELLGLIPHPDIFHYARFNVLGSPASKRKIKPLVEEGKVEGWDDIRLVTIKGMKRRGIVPEAIKQVIKEVGMTTQPTNIDWSLITATNRKIIDAASNRYFFVSDPIVIYIEDAPEDRICKIPLHPDDSTRGFRKVKPGCIFLIAKSDYEKMKINDEFRLKDLYNVILTKKKAPLNKITSVKIDEELKPYLKKFPIHCIGKYSGEELKPGPKIQWVIADAKQTVAVEVKVPGVLFIDDTFNENSLKIETGYAEAGVAKLKPETIVQFERYGFVRVETKTKSKIFVNLAHK
ncbi:MAG: glutamate--tRNA ligase [Candidatus Heimdallarchaeota archaeon]